MKKIKMNKRKEILKKISFLDEKEYRAQLPEKETEAEEISPIQIPPSEDILETEISKPEISETDISVSEPTLSAPESIQETTVSEEGVSNYDRIIFNEILFDAIKDFVQDKISANELDPEIALQKLQEIKQNLNIQEQAQFLAAANKKTNTLKK